MNDIRMFLPGAEPTSEYYETHIAHLNDVIEQLEEKCALQQAKIEDLEQFLYATERGESDRFHEERGA